MKHNLDTLKTEITKALRDAGFIVFHGMSRAADKTPEIEWDTDRYPDYRRFVEVAKELGVKLVVVHHNEFDSAVLDRALAELQDSELEFEEQRRYEKRLNDLKIYDGFTCSIELSFDHGGITYFFELHTEWYEEADTLLQELDLGALDEALDEDDGSYGGYYSKN